MCCFSTAATGSGLCAAAALVVGAGLGSASALGGWLVAAGAVRADTLDGAAAGLTVSAC